MEKLTLDWHSQKAAPHATSLEKPSARLQSPDTSVIWKTKLPLDESNYTDHTLLISVGPEMP